MKPSSCFARTRFFQAAPKPGAGKKKGVESVEAIASRLEAIPSRVEVILRIQSQRGHTASGAFLHLFFRPKENPDWWEDVADLSSENRSRNMSFLLIFHQWGNSRLLNTGLGFRVSLHVLEEASR